MFGITSYYYHYYYYYYYQHHHHQQHRSVPTILIQIQYFHHVVADKLICLPTKMAASSVERC